jgi:hypothetical protein
MREKCKLTTIEWKCSLNCEENVKEWGGVEKKLYSLRVCAWRCGQHVEQSKNKRSGGAKKTTTTTTRAIIYMHACIGQGWCMHQWRVLAMECHKNASQSWRRDRRRPRLHNSTHSLHTRRVKGMWEKNWVEGSQTQLNSSLSLSNWINNTIQNNYARNRRVHPNTHIHTCHQVCIVKSVMCVVELSKQRHVHSTEYMKVTNHPSQEEKQNAMHFNNLVSCCKCKYGRAIQDCS